MELLQRFFNYPPLPPPRQHDDIDHSWVNIDKKKQLTPIFEQAISPYCPKQHDNSFKACLADHFDELTLIKKLAESDLTVVLHVTYTHSEHIYPIALRINRHENLFQKHSNAATSHYCMSSTSLGSEWQLFLEDSPLSSPPQFAIAWTGKSFNLLTAEEIRNYAKQPTQIRCNYTLYATLSPYSENSPFLFNTLLPGIVTKELAQYLPQQNSDKLQFCLATYFAEFTLEEPLGSNDKVGAWKASIVQQDKTTVHMTFRLIKIQAFQNEGIKDSLFRLWHSGAGAEWQTLFGENNSLSYAIAWDQQRACFKIFNSIQIKELYQKRNSLRPNIYTLYGILTSYEPDKALILTYLPSNDVVREVQTSLSKKFDSNKFYYVLVTSFPDFKLLKTLGEGQTSRVWKVSYKNKENEEQVAVFRLGNLDTIEHKHKEAIGKYFQMTSERFGGEWIPFLTDSEHVLSTFYGIVWDKQNSCYRLFSKADVMNYHRNRHLIGDNVFTLVATFSPYYENSQDLATYFKAKGTLSVDKLETFARQLLLGLALLPEGMIHRDLKPANILVTKNEILKIIDFGFSALEEDLTQTMVGTPLYMAPEVLLHKGYDQSADLYSLYAMLFQLATGNPPIQAQNYNDLFKKATVLANENKNPKEDSRLASFSEDFRNFMGRLGHPDPKQRWSTRRLLQEDTFLGNREVPPSPVTLRAPPPAAISSSPSAVQSPLIPRVPSQPSIPTQNRLHHPIIILFVLAGTAYVLYHLAKRLFVSKSLPSKDQPAWFRNRTYRRD